MFATPARRAFHELGPHHRGHSYGAFQSEWFEVVRVGGLAIYEVEWHDDKSNAPCRSPALILGIFGPRRELVAIKVVWLVNGAMIDEFKRWGCAQRKPALLQDSPDVYLIDEDWIDDEFPVQDLRGRLRAQLIDITSTRSVDALPSLAAGTIFLGGVLRSTLGKREYKPVLKDGSRPMLQRLQLSTRLRASLATAGP